MPFPEFDIYWKQTRDFLKSRIKPLEPLLASPVFLEEFAGVYPYQCLYAVKKHVDFKWAVIHKGEISNIGEDYLKEIVAEFTPVFANTVFVVFSKDDGVAPIDKNNKHMVVFWKKIDSKLKRSSVRDTSNNLKNSWCGIVMTTFNRPSSLKRSMQQIIALDAPVIIVDDGSNPKYYEKNFSIAQKYNAPILKIPQNRGLCCARNMGISYFLADPEIEWISCLEDDATVSPDMLDIMAKVQDSKLRPLCTGYDAAEHISYKQISINGHKVSLKRSTPGVHMHAHRSYWMSVMPIPTPYLGAPKKNRGLPGQGSDCDWWVASWSPNSVAKKGLYVTCVPGLVDTFLCGPYESTWGGGKPGFKSVRHSKALQKLRKLKRMFQCIL